MAIELWRASGVFMTAVDEDVVVLDVPSDRYHCLPEAAAWLSIGDDGSLSAPGPVADALVAAGFATTDRPPVPGTLAPQALHEVTLQPASRSDCIRAGVILTSAALAFRGRRLADLIAPDRSSFTARPPDLTRLGELAAAARIATPWLPFEGACLQRSFQLRRLLARHEIDSTWVFGVRTWPFAAHCWLQVGAVIVGDRLERVARYAPIMTV